MTFTISIRVIAEIRKIGYHPYNRIIMEKEKKNFTYKELRTILKQKYKFPIDAENLKKKLTGGRKPDPILVMYLNEILGIQGEIDNEEAAVIYYYIKNRPKFESFPTKCKKEEQQEVYDLAYQLKHPCYIYKLVLDYLDNVEKEEADELEQTESNLLKSALLIYREFPQVFDELFNTVIFEEEDREKLKRLEIKIREH